jgi:hypothetical protein
MKSRHIPTICIDDFLANYKDSSIELESIFFVLTAIFWAIFDSVVYFEFMIMKILAQPLLGPVGRGSYFLSPCL